MRFAVIPAGSPGRLRFMSKGPVKRNELFAATEDDEQIIERVAALDIGKAEVVCCVRLPAPEGKSRRVQEVSTHSTMVGSLSDLANHLVELGIERVVMEATSDYWRPPFYLFEGRMPAVASPLRQRRSGTLRGAPRGRRLEAGARCARSPSDRCCGLLSPPRLTSVGCGA